MLLRVMEEMNRVGPRLKAVTQPGEGIDTTPRVAVSHPPVTPSSNTLQ